MCAVLMAVDSPTSPRRRSGFRSSSEGNLDSRPARVARRPCVFPSSLLSVSSTFEHPASSTQLTASAQIVAAIISLLNDYLISKGEPPLGFLNYWLYGDGLAGLNDITSGSNPGCNTDGFSAVAKWDPVRPSRLVSLHFRRWLTLGSIGHRSRDARLYQTEENN